MLARTARTFILTSAAMAAAFLLHAPVLPAGTVCRSLLLSQSSLHASNPTQVAPKLSVDSELVNNVCCISDIFLVTSCSSSLTPPLHLRLLKSTALECYNAYMC